MSDRSVLARTPPPARHHLAYGDAPEQYGHLRLPAGTGPFPAIAYIHGGFWRAQYDLTHAGHLCAAFTAMGIATWNIEYRRLGNPGGGWPGTFQDIAAAIQHLFAIAPNVDIDPARIVVGGHSAGGHLALWAAGQERVPQDSPISGRNHGLSAAFSLAGVVDLRRAWELQLGAGVTGELLGGSPEEVPERYQAASPIELMPLLLPQLLVHGRADEIVPVALSEDYVSVAGEAATLLALPNAGHFEVIDPRSEVWPDVAAGVMALFANRA
jgi:acetyl esterase/lipase